MVFPWVPTVDGEFLEDSPHNLLQSRAYAAKDALLGVNKDEGTYWILYSLPGFSKDNVSTQTDAAFEQGVRQIAWDLTPPLLSDVTQLYRSQRDVNVSREEANRDALCHVCGDRSFTSATKRLADTLSRDNNNTSTYMYELSYRASNEEWPPWMGVIHGAEIQVSGGQGSFMTLIYRSVGVRGHSWRRG